MALKGLYCAGVPLRNYSLTLIVYSSVFLLVFGIVCNLPDQCVFCRRHNYNIVSLTLRNANVLSFYQH